MLIEREIPRCQCQIDPLYVHCLLLIASILAFDLFHLWTRAYQFLSLLKISAASDDRKLLSLDSKHRRFALMVLGVTPGFMLAKTNTIYLHPSSLLFLTKIFFL